MNPLRILHADLHLSWGGGQRQVLLLARGLAARGHRTWVATPPGSALGKRSRAAGLPVIDFRYRVEFDPRTAWSMARLVRRLEPDVLHAHEAHALTPALLAARAARPRPAVVAHRRVVFPIRGGLLSRWKYAHGPERVIAIGRAVRDALIASGVPPERIAVVHSAVEIDPARDAPTWAAAPAASLRTRIAAPTHAPIVLTIASLIPAKDHTTLIASAGRLRPREPMTRWVVVGGGDLLPSARAEVGRNGLVGRVHYLGFDPAPRALLPQADVFALASASEGLGTSVLDAMAAGVPVVATRAGGIPEIVEHERSGLLVPVGDPDAIAAAVDRLLDDPDLARHLAAAGRERVRGFDVETAVEATEEVYREAIAAARAER
jgi:glycosyltransferase involved in cell wall biosynthesis